MTRIAVLMALLVEYHGCTFLAGTSSRLRIGGGRGWVAGPPEMVVRPLARAGVLLLLMLAPLCVQAQIRVTDDQGNPVVLARPAQRILSLAPHVTELLFAAGAGDRIVATVRHADHPPAARALPRVGDAHRLDRERIRVLRPDLIVAWASGTPARALEALRALSVPLYLSEPRRLADIADNLRDFGRLAGTAEIAGPAAAVFEQRLATLRARYRSAPRTPVFLQISLHPLMTVNGEHIISEVAALCSGENIFADLPQLAARVSVEAVITARPAAIVFGSQDGGQVRSVRDFWSQWPDLPAVRDNRLIAVPADFLHRPTPRILDGAEMVCRQPGIGEP